MIATKGEYTDKTALDKMLPFGKYRFVDVEFPDTANTDTIVRPGMSVENPANWRFIDINAQSVFNSDGYARDGEWFDIDYSSGNFTGSGSMTWTVDSADVELLRMVVNGYQATVEFRIIGTDVGGTASTALRITIPSEFVISGGARSFVAATDAGTVVNAQLITDFTGSADSTHLLIYKYDGSNWTLTTGDNTSVIGSLTFGLSEKPVALEAMPYVYRSANADARAQGNEYLILRCTVPGYRTKLLVFEERN